MHNLKNEIQNWIGVFGGTIIMCVGFVIFINPYNIVPGGVYGASIVLHNLFPYIQVGTFGYFFDIPLLILSMWLLGKRLGLKTIASSLSTPLFMNGLSWLVYPNEQALQNLDPAQLLDGRLNLESNLILAVIMGSVLIGIGCGIIVRCGATSGGTDIIGLLLQKYAHIKFSRAIMLVDSFVVLFGLIVFTAMHNGATNSLTLMFYSLIAIWICSQAVARTLNGSKDDKIMFVISNQNLHTLHDYILHDMDRSATLIKSSGLYSGEDKEMLFIVISYKEVQRLKYIVNQADPSAFVVVTDAYDTYGEGWKSLPKENEIHPE